MDVEDLGRVAAAAAAALPAAADQSWLAGHDLQENYSRFTSHSHLHNANKDSRHKRHVLQT